MNTPRFGDLFYLDTAHPEALADGAEFRVVYPPEATTGHGWQVVTLRVVRAALLVHDRQAGRKHRMYAEVGCRDIGADEARRLWAAVNERLTQGQGER